MKSRIFKKKLSHLFKSEVQIGANEEVGSLDFFKFKNRNYSVIKSSDHEYDFYAEDSFLPILTIKNIGK